MLNLQFLLFVLHICIGKRKKRESSYPSNTFTISWVINVMPSSFSAQLNQTLKTSLLTSINEGVSVRTTERALVKIREDADRNL